MAEGSVRIRIPAGLLDATAGERELRADGATVREVLVAIDARYPGFGERLLDVSGLRRGFAVYVDGANIRLANGLDTSLEPSAQVMILPVAGIGA